MGDWPPANQKINMPHTVHGEPFGFAQDRLVEPRHRRVAFGDMKGPSTGSG